MSRQGKSQGPAAIVVGPDSVGGLTLDTVFRSEASRLTRFLRKRLPRTEDPQDYVQEAFLRLAGASPENTLRNPEAYLQRIVRNLLIDRSRRAARVQYIEIEEVEVAVPPDQAHEIEASDMRRLYSSAVGALPPRTREVFLLSRVHEVGYKDIAGRLGISVRTVEWHIAEAIVRIEKALDRE